MVRNGKTSKVLWQFSSPSLAKLGAGVGLVELKWGGRALTVTEKPLPGSVLQSGWEQTNEDVIPRFSPPFPSPGSSSCVPFRILAPVLLQSPPT